MRENEKKIFICNELSHMNKVVVSVLAFKFSSTFKIMLYILKFIVLMKSNREIH